MDSKIEIKSSTVSSACDRVRVGRSKENGFKRSFELFIYGVGVMAGGGSAMHQSAKQKETESVQTLLKFCEIGQAVTTF